MEFGIALKLIHDAKAEARLAEQLGFDYLATGEHISFHVATTNTIVALAAAAGSPDDCIEQINSYRQAGAETIIFGQGCPPEYSELNTRLIAESILPAFA